ncbi:uncharacterized protein METZ01_LOCUS173771 [marine metagenome]|uniref:Uncharacterized protein n=1 Tax=marine metagenome TaxID=408172 RepID=A0A382C673_9ZZZZ
MGIDWRITILLIALLWMGYAIVQWIQG